MESGATEVTVKNTTFRNSTSNAKNGGALNVWSGNSDNTSGKPTTNCYVTLDNCIFEHCYANNGSGTNGNGGAIYHDPNCRSNLSRSFTSLTDCTIIGCTAKQSGGALWTYAQNADQSKKLLDGCTIKPNPREDSFIWIFGAHIKENSDENVFYVVTREDADSKAFVYIYYSRK